MCEEKWNEIYIARLKVKFLWIKSTLLYLTLVIVEGVLLDQFFFCSRILNERETSIIVNIWPIFLWRTVEWAWATSNGQRNLSRVYDYILQGSKRENEWKKKINLSNIILVETSDQIHMVYESKVVIICGVSEVVVEWAKIHWGIQKLDIGKLICIFLCVVGIFNGL